MQKPVLQVLDNQAIVECTRASGAYTGDTASGLTIVNNNTVRNQAKTALGLGDPLIGPLNYQIDGIYGTEIWGHALGSIRKCTDVTQAHLEAGWSAVLDYQNTQPFRTDWQAGLDCRIALRTSTGLMMMFAKATPGALPASPTDVLLKIYHATFVNGSWVWPSEPVHTATKGYISEVPLAVKGDEIWFGDYTSSPDTQLNGTPGTDGYVNNVHYSADGGATWTTISNYDNPSPVGMHGHIHGIVSDPDSDTIYAILDKPCGGIVKFVKPANWQVGQQWTGSWFNTTVVGSGGVIQDGRLWLTDETASGAMVGGYAGSIYSIPLDGSVDRRIEMRVFEPGTQAGTNWRGLRYQDSSTDIRYVGGMFFATLIRFDTNEGNRGLYVSKDGRRWTALWRLETGARGIYQIFGAINGKLVCRYHDGTGSRPMIFPMPKATLVQSIVVEPEQTNLARPPSPDLSFESIDGNGNLRAVAKSTGTLTLSAVAGGKVGSNALKIAHRGCTSTPLCSEILLGYYQNTGMVPLTVGAKAILSFWAKVEGATYPIQFEVRFKRSNATYWATYDPSGSYESAYPLRVEQDWVRYFIPFTVLIDSTGRYDEIDIQVTRLNASSNSLDYDIYLDGLHVFQNTDGNHRMYSPTFIHGTRKADLVSVPLEGSHSDWSIAWDWWPMEGWADVGTGIPIVGLDNGVSDRFQVTWAPNATRTNAGAIAVTNSSDATVDSTTEVYKWRHHDLLRFCLTYTGSTLTLYVRDPVNGLVTKSMTLADLTDVKRIRLGHDVLGAVGVGRFANVRHWTNCLSADDIDELFSRARLTHGRLNLGAAGVM